MTLAGARTLKDELLRQFTTRKDRCGCIKYAAMIEIGIEPAPLRGPAHTLAGLNRDQTPAILQLIQQPIRQFRDCAVDENGVVGPSFG